MLSSMQYYTQVPGNTNRTLAGQMRSMVATPLVPNILYQPGEYEQPGAKAWAWKTSPPSFLERDAGLEQLQEGKIEEGEQEHARPQIINGTDYWPEYWGVTVAQCRALLDTLREEVKNEEWNASFNVYEYVERKIKPLTKGKGYSYALLVNKDKPKKVNTMVSHAWSENAIEFLETICRSCSEADVIFICALSLYQNEDNCGPSIAEQLGSQPEESPFQRVLQCIADDGSRDSFWYHWRTTVSNLRDFIGIGALCTLFTPPVLDGVVYTFDQSAFKDQYCPPDINDPTCDEPVYAWMWGTIWHWFRLCWPATIVLLLLFVTLTVILACVPMYKGRMIVIPNRGTDLYDRLWCVYEIFIARKLRVPCVLGHTMASAGSSSCRKATCASAADQQKIQNEIVTEYGEMGYEYIDEDIRRLTRELHISVFRLVCLWGFPIVIAGLAYYNMYDRNRCRLEFWGDTCGLVLVVIGLVFAYFKEFKSAQGVAKARNLCTLALAQFTLFLVFEGIRELSNSRKACSCDPVSSQTNTKLFFAFAFGFSKAARLGFFFAFICSAFVLAYRRPRSFRRTPLQFILFAIMCVCFCILRAFAFGEKRIPRQSWSDMTQAYPEAFYIITECLAVFAFPLNGIWGAAVYWGLTVEWEDFWNSAAVKEASATWSEDDTDSG